jgi:predicted RNA-binding protein
MGYWLVVGAPKNWDTAFKNKNIWGLRQTQTRLWENLKESDNLIFYATSPVKGIIGFGAVRTKFRQNKPLWSDEIKQNKIIWPLRFEFDIKFCLPPDKWVTEKLVTDELWPRAGFQLLAEATGQKILSFLDKGEYHIKEFKQDIVEEPITEYTDTTEMMKAPSTHEKIKEILVEIGSIQGYLAESEYNFDIGKLDVVWRRVLNSVPTYVFEIQVSGDIYHALSKLKHAFDLWNSHIYVVASEKERGKVDNLLSGTFHEISDRINFIELQQVEELYIRKKSYLDFETSLGIK